MMTYDIKRKTNCSICNSRSLERVAELPNFPLTGMFVEVRPEKEAPIFDQDLMSCAACGHLQLSRVLPPSLLYGEQYTFRSSASHATPSAISFVADYIDKLSAGKKFECALEIGCNDLVLLKELGKRANSAVGVDPIWATRDAPYLPTNLSVLGGIAEDIDLGADLEARPDLIVSTHNLEHIDEPRLLLNRLMEIAADDALFVMEIPDTDCMIRNQRFDQVFHEHIHYLNFGSFMRLIQECGGTYVGHCRNYRHWGGSLSLAFCKGSKYGTHALAEESIRYSLGELKDKYRFFRNGFQQTSEQIEDFNGKVWGYGAGQMVPSVAYHMGGGFSKLGALYDDSPRRDGLYYPGLKTQIRCPSPDQDFSQDGILITSLDAVRPIMGRVLELAPRAILLPIRYL